ncbi:DUF342 domain-containing protein [Cellulosilyticum sp. I15G10I2]|uniref:DUF342 domain-containing protein n=1 Tax=Cellulosilyticum sp. I15G10I2 TaxID=1892843 RepID=UPI00085C4775|nr:FapA family protein [Cellulosilyticum sp. I15G10I2]
MILVQNEYFSIIEENQILFIQVVRSGFSIRDFQIIMEKYPAIVITKFLVLKQALEHVANEKIEFGNLKPPVELYISPDNLEAKVSINLDKETYAATKEAIKEEILKQLRENKIVHGILYDVINKELTAQKNIIVAKGTLPGEGTDARIIYLELSDMKPNLHDDGRTNYYDMNLVRHVHKGDWLGEKVFAKLGADGMNIKGEVLPGKPGKDKNLRFEQSSVETIEKENKTVLIAKFDGALQIKEGKIGVINHLMISKNVGTETGNIEFDGYVTIEGTVEDGFSVTAKHDISILGSIGVGAAEKIYSKLGNVYIKGGVSGKGKCIVEAGGSVFLKYANACAIKAQDTIDIGYYALDSDLSADSILVQAKNGRTIGGTIRAKNKVSLRMVGNIYEKETYINVAGFDRKAIKKQLDELLLTYKELVIKAERNERELKVYEMTLVQFGRTKSDEDYMSYQKIHQELVDEIYKLEEERKALLKILSSKGEGEVTIYDKAYPRTLLQIKNLQKRLTQVTTGTFYAQDNRLMFD